MLEHICKRDGGLGRKRDSNRCISHLIARDQCEESEVKDGKDVHLGNFTQRWMFLTFVHGWDTGEFNHGGIRPPAFSVASLLRWQCSATCWR